MYQHPKNTSRTSISPPQHNIHLVIVFFNNDLPQDFIEDHNDQQFECCDILDKGSKRKELLNKQKKMLVVYKRES